MGREIWMLRTEEIPAGLRATLDRVCVAAYEGGFAPGDWADIGPGLHFLLFEAGELLSHAMIVERELHTGPHRLQTGYVEVVATRPDRQGEGLGTAVMRAIGDRLAVAYPLGGLDSGSQPFYARLGWEVWRGPTFIRTADGPLRTPEEDGNVMILRTRTTPTDLDLGAPISAEDRPGEKW